MRWWIAIGLAGCWTGKTRRRRRRDHRRRRCRCAGPRAVPGPDGDLDHGHRLVKTKHCMFCHRPKLAESMARGCDPAASGSRSRP